MQRDVLQPTVDEMARRGTPFRGLLYAGLALTSRGVRVVEFNARFGDPETQPLLALLDSPLSPLLVGAATGTLDAVPAPVWKPGAAVAVVMASKGYPESSSKGDVIVGTETLDREDDVDVIHAGTALDASGHLVTAGGRVLAVTAVGATSPTPGPRPTKVSPRSRSRAPSGARHRRGKVGPRTLHRGARSRPSPSARQVSTGPRRGTDRAAGTRVPSPGMNAPRDRVSQRRAFLLRSRCGLTDRHAGSSSRRARG